MDPTTSLVLLKRMAGAAVDPVLSDPEMAALLDVCRREDAAGLDFTQAGWVPTFHLEWGAAEAWAWKAGACSDQYKVIGDGTELDRNQKFQHCTAMFNLYNKKAANRPYSIRAHGNLLEDRLGAYSAVPWWWEVSA